MVIRPDQNCALLGDLLDLGPPACNIGVGLIGADGGRYKFNVQFLRNRCGRLL